MGKNSLLSWATRVYCRSMNTLHYTSDDARAILLFAVLLMLCGVVLLVSALIKHVRRQTNFIANDELTSERITVDFKGNKHE